MLRTLIIANLTPTDISIYYNWQVFDEADMLLCGGFQNKVIRLINMLRFDEKLLSRSNKSVSEWPMELESESLSNFNLDDTKDLKTEIISEGEDDSEDVDVDNVVGDVDVDNVVEDADVDNSVEDVENGSNKRKDWRRVRKYYERSKQYIFVAATLPVNGKKTAGAVLKHMFPNANWVSGNYLHCHNPRCGIIFWLPVIIPSVILSSFGSHLLEAL